MKRAETEMFPILLVLVLALRYYFIILVCGKRCNWGLSLRSYAYASPQILGDGAGAGVSKSKSCLMKDEVAASLSGG